MPRPCRLALESLEGRDLLAVYYFSGGNLFGPQQAGPNDPYWVANPSAWDNPFNWAKGDAFLVGEGVPASGDTAVFRTGNEDGTPWVVQFENGPGPNPTALAGGGSVIAPLGADVNTLNLDPNWAGHTLTAPGGVTVAAGRWQAGAIVGNVTNNGGVSIEPTGANPVVSVGLGTFQNNGSISLSGGRFALGYETGVVPYAATLVNDGTFSISDGAVLTRASNPNSHVLNTGRLSGAGTIEVDVTTPQGGVLQAGGALTLFGSHTANGGTLRAGTGSTLTFAGTGAFPLYGSTAWGGVVTIDGGGTVRVAPAPGGGATMTLADATFAVAPTTSFSVGNANVGQTGGSRVTVTGLGRLPAGSTMTFLSADLVGAFENDGTVVLAGTAAPTGQHEDNRLNGFFQNDGTLVVQAPAVYSTGVVVNATTGLLEFRTTSNYFGSGGLIQNLGTVRAAAGVSGVLVRAAFDNLNGTIDVRSGHVSLTNNFGPAANGGDERGRVFRAFGAFPSATGISVGGTFLVAPGATLDLRSGDFFTPGGVFAGNYTGSGGGRVLLGGNQQMMQSDWNLPAGMLQWGAADETGTSRLTGSWTNSGDLTLPTIPGSPARSLKYATLTNRGTLTLAAGARLDLFEDFQPGPSSLVNAPGGTVTFLGGNLLRGPSPGTLVGAFAAGVPLFHNLGLARFLGGTNLDALVDNNAGTFESVGAGVGVGYFRGRHPGLEDAAVAGAWLATGGGVFDFYRMNQTQSQPVVATFRGTAVLDGAGSAMPWLRGVELNTGSIAVANGAALALGGYGTIVGVPALNRFTNAGTLGLDGGTVALPGTFTQSAAGTFSATVGGAASRLTAGGTATLGGTLAATVVDGVTLAPADRFDVLTAPSVTGAFAADDLDGVVSLVSTAAVTLAPVSVAADLVVEGVEVLTAGEVAPGALVSVRYTVRNVSPVAVPGGWLDSLFLSADDRLDPTDLPLGRFTDAGGLAAFASRTLTVTLAAPARPGAWAVIVAADGQVTIPDTNRANNVAAAATPLRIAYAELPLHTDVSAAFPAGDTTYYRLTLAPGSGPVRVSARFAAGIAGDVSVRFAELPLGTADDHVGNFAGGAAAVDIPAGTAGVYFVAVRRTGPGAVTLRAERPALAISGLGDEANLSSAVRVGDRLTLLVRGGGFTPATTFALGSAAAVGVVLRDGGTAEVTFVVPAEAGPLFVSAANGAAPVVYAGKAFTPVAADANTLDRLARWTVTLDFPTDVRRRQAVRGTLTFRNDSPYSQPAPLLQLAAVDALLGLPSQAAPGFESLQILGARPDGSLAAYAPGETGTVEFVLLPIGGVAGRFDVLATVFAEQDFAPGLPSGVAGPVAPGVGTIVDQPLPAGYAAGFATPSVPADAWANAVAPRLAALVGPTYRSYADALRGAAATIAADGGDPRDVGRLVRYLVNVADDFGAVSARFRVSAFGRGQENPYDVRAALDAGGNLIMTVGNATRPFVARGGGVYAGVFGDRATAADRAGGGWLVTEPDGSVIAFRPDGRFDYRDDFQGRRTTATYTAGRLTTLTEPPGTATTFTHDAAGRVASVSIDGRAVTYGYDATGNLASVTTATGTTTYGYAPDTTGPLAFARTRVTGPDGVTTTFEYDALGRLARTVVGGQLATTFAYGVAADPGRVTTTAPGGLVSSLVRGESGRTTERSDATGTTDFTFDEFGRPTGYTSPTAGTVAVPRDADGNEIAAIGPSGAAVRTTYNADGRPTALRDPLGRLTSFGRDALGRLAAESDPLGTTEYGHDANGNLRITVTAGGRATTTTYGANTLPSRTDYADGSFTTYQYDARRNLTTVTDADAGGTNPRAVTLAYDAADRVTLVTYADGSSVGYRYDTAGRIDRITPSTGPAIDYGFDALGRLSTVSRGGAVEVGYGYDAAGRLATKAFANGTRTTTAYDAAGRVARIEHTGPGGGVLDFQEYAYNAQNLVASLTTPDGVTTYGYDLHGQLTRVATASDTTAYEYDAAGNRHGYAVNDANQYTATAGGASYVHDADGNLTARTAEDGQAQTQYGYDARGRLVYQNGSAGTFRYEYDPLGNRSAVTVNGVRTALLVDPLGGRDGLGDVLSETTAGALAASYLPGLGIEARFDAAGVGSFYHHDLQGSTAALTDAAGVVSAAYRYGAFGEVLSATGAAAAANPYRFNGAFGVADRGTGLLDMRSRFYDPVLGRFTQRDPIGLAGADANRYRFAANNPVTYGDPSGLWVGAYPAASYVIGSVGLPGVYATVSQLAGTPVGQAGSYALVRGLGAFASGVSQSASVFSPFISYIATRLGAAELLAATTTSAYVTGGAATTATAVTATTVTAEAGLGFATLGAYVALPAAGAFSFFGPDLLLGDGHFTQSLFDGDTGTRGPLQNPPYSLDTVKTILGDKDLRDLVLNFFQRMHRLPTRDELAELMRILHQGRLGNYNTSLVTGKSGRAGIPVDPNDIVGPAGFGPEGFLVPTGDLPYMIRFENLPAATASAQVVTVTQKLDADLDWDTFRLGAFGFGAEAFAVPAGRTSYSARLSYPARNAVVDVAAVFDPATGALTWTFTTLDPVTLDQPVTSASAGFLPPNDASGIGQGYVSYTVRARANPATGTRYDAQASIVFDTETPLLTPAIFNTADTGRPTAAALPLPATTTGTDVTVSWAGADDAGGSGVAGYDVYRSVNGGAWAPWFTNTTLTSAVYSGAAGDTVAVYVVAADNVGLAQPTPAAAQATTRLAGGTVPTPPVPGGTPAFAVGAGVGGAPVVITYGSDGAVTGTRTVFADDFRGGVRTAMADFTGDGVPDLAVGTGPGAHTQIRVFDGATGAEVFAVAPFEAAFVGGVYLAAGDLDGDGRAELVVTPDEGGGPRVQVYAGGTFGKRADFMGIDDASFRGGARAALGDVNADGFADLVVSAGFGGGPRVAVFDGGALAGGRVERLVNDFFLFEPALRNGAFVAAGDVDGDGSADVIGGGGPGGAPRVYALSGRDLLTGRERVLANFFAGDEDTRGGVRVAVKNLDGDERADVVAGDGTGVGSHVTGYLGKDIGPSGAPPERFAVDAYPGFAGGVFVG